jgi:phage/plasmid-associated DNA primase
LNKAPEALQRVWRLCRFSEPTESRDAVQRYQAANDAIAAWLDEHTDASGDAIIPQSELHAAYASHCRRHYRRPANKQSFGRLLKVLRPEAHPRAEQSLGSSNMGVCRNRLARLRSIRSKHATSNYGLAICRLRSSRLCLAWKAAVTDAISGPVNTEGSQAGRPRLQASTLRNRNADRAAFKSASLSSSGSHVASPFRQLARFRRSSSARTAFASDSVSSNGLHADEPSMQRSRFRLSEPA